MKVNILLLAVLVIFTSCKPEPIDYAIISGQLNTANDFIEISQDSIIKEIELDSNGKFIDTIYNASNYYTLSSGKNKLNLYLNNGYNVNFIALSKTLTDSITFSGIGAKENEYLKAKSVNTPTLMTVFPLFAKEEAEFIQEYSKYKISGDSLLNSFDKLDESFLSIEKENLKYQWLNNFIKYEDYHRANINDWDYNASEVFFKTIDDADFSNDNLFKNVESYKTYIDNYYYAYGNNDIDVFHNKLKNIKSETIRNHILKNQIDTRLHLNNKNADRLYKIITDISKDEDILNAAKKKHNIMKNLKKGNPSPTFKDYRNVNGETNSLADFKGQYVFLDVWSVYCGPCIKAMPEYNTLVKAYPKIKFISIITDDYKQHNKRWRKLLKDNNSFGTHLIADNELDSEFIKNYSIYGWPRYIIIDPDQNIVTANAPKIGDPKLVELLDTL